jgi:hypothetical protein
MILWIFGAFCLSFPVLEVNFLLTTHFLTKAISSVFFKAKSFLILLALFGPNLLGISTSVRPGISLSPFLEMERATTQISCPIMHPLTDFLFLSPVLLSL